MKRYKPQPETAEILNWCLEKVNSVPYKVTLRWIFYRAVQERGLTKKDYDKFKKWLSRARKSFWNGWRPDTLVDDTRYLVALGNGFKSFQDWVKNIGEQKPEYEKFSNQENIVVVLFEAEAMTSQFRYYCNRYHVPYAPFRGDPSIDFKWRIANYLAKLALEYEKPIQILYFGDYEPVRKTGSRGKGITIPLDALKDIRHWYKVNWYVELAKKEGLSLEDLEELADRKYPELRFERCGLNPEHIERWNLPENPTRPGEYQWEALGDEEAKELIENSIERYWNLKAVEEIEEKEGRDAERWQERWGEVEKQLLRGL